LTKKIKVLTISDHPLSPSGVGTQTKNICTSLLETGRYSIISLGGAIKHQSYDPIKVEPYDDDWQIIPVDSYGTQEMIRSVVRQEKPDILWIMTDPRFWGWLWSIENEIRPLVPIVYYHVWDNYPYPYFNHKYYASNDHVAAISKVSYDIVKTVAPDTDSSYIPHAVDDRQFRPLNPEEIKNLRKENLLEADRDKFLLFWNNRNARRKQSGTLVYWFKEWLDKNDLHEKAQLIMHTDPSDPHGQDLHEIIDHLELSDHRQVMLSVQKIAPGSLAALYNMADCTVNISDAEGFGLSTLESLSCGTPIVVNMTGGLQEQVTDGQEWFGIGLHPTSKSIIGSQEVPYIYEDRLSKEQFFSALTKMYKMTSQARREMGLKGFEHIRKNYNYETFKESWIKLMDSIVEKYGSWDTRKHYNSIRFKEVA